MPKRSNEFQQLVSLIERALQSSDVTVTESRELEDKSTGRPREVDVVLESRQGAHPFIISVECRAGSSPRPASIEWVEQMWGKHATLPTNKLILVAKGGFTAAARQKAGWLNVTLLELREATECDWGSVVRRLTNIRLVSFLVPEARRVTIVLPKPASPAATTPQVDDPAAVELTGPDGRTVRVADLVNEWLRDPAFVRTMEEQAFTDAPTLVWFERPLVKGVSFVDSAGVRRDVLAIAVEARCVKKEQELPLAQRSYGEADVAHATGSSFGAQFQVAFTQMPGEDARAAWILQRARAQGASDSGTTDGGTG
jgi:hypothetical protein